MFEGCFTALITPFTEEGEVDFVHLKKIINWQIEEGIDGLVLCGSTGEGASLTKEEKCAIFQLGVETANKRVPIIATTGTNVTYESVALTKEAKKMGVDGALAIVPYYNRPTEEGCFQHFSHIANVGLPTILYHHPGRTGIKLSVETISRICALKNIVGIKDATGDVPFAKQIMQAIDVPFFSGDDGLLLPLAKEGAKGSISVVSNVIPHVWKEYVKQALHGGNPEAIDLVNAMVLETNPQCVKYAVSQLGKCSSKMRLPLLEPGEENKGQIQALLSTSQSLRS